MVTTRYLELQSSGRRDELRLHYSPLSSTNPAVSALYWDHHDHHDQKQVVVETFPLRLADDSWHRLAVMVSGDQIEVKTIIFLYQLNVYLLSFNQHWLLNTNHPRTIIFFITIIIIITITLLECWVFKVW